MIHDYRAWTGPDSEAEAHLHSITMTPCAHGDLYTAHLTGTEKSPTWRRPAPQKNLCFWSPQQIRRLRLTKPAFQNLTQRCF